MDNKVKQVIVTVTSMILIFVFYSIYVYNHHIAGDPEIINDFGFWGKMFLILIPVTIVAQIVIHIIFAIINKAVTNEDFETKSDERDKLINLKSIQVSHYIFTAGFLLAMVSQVVGMQPYVMFLTLVGTGFISGIVSELAKICYYRRGVRYE